MLYVGIQPAVNLASLTNRLNWQNLKKIRVLSVTRTTSDACMRNAVINFVENYNIIIVIVQIPVFGIKSVMSNFFANEEVMVRSVCHEHD